MSADKGFRILFIEDDWEMVTLVRYILGQRDFKVFGARTGLEGLEAMRRDPPDLVLLDLMLPGIDGWEVHRRMKADPRLQEIPVIVVSAKTQGVDLALGLHVAKVDGYITKPFSIGELVKTVERALGKGDQEDVASFHPTRITSNSPKLSSAS